MPEAKETRLQAWRRRQRNVNLLLAEDIIELHEAYTLLSAMPWWCKALLWLEGVVSAVND